jgi:two-component system, NarL family, response regulator NreC
MAHSIGNEAGVPITIVLADDHTIMRNGLRMLLDAENGLEVVAEAATIQLVFREVRTHRPDVLVLDLNMPGGSSVDAIGTLASISPNTSVVMLTMEHDPYLRRDAYLAGVSGYVLKDSASKDLVRAIRQAARGKPRSSARGLDG